MTFRNRLTLTFTALVAVAGLIMVIAVNTIMRTVGGAFGASIPASILAAHTLAGTAVPTEHAFTMVFWVTAAAMGAAVLIGLAVPSRRAAHATAGASATAGAAH